MWNIIEFDKKLYGFKEYQPREWNSRRIAAAKRALEKEIEKAGLFPELMRFHSVEERVIQIDTAVAQRIKQFRDDVASDLWKCRREFKSLPANIQKDVINFWNKSFAPKEPFRLLSLINRYKQDPLYFEREKGNASRYTMSVIKDGVLKVIEISKEQYWKNITQIDSK